MDGLRSQGDSTVAAGLSRTGRPSLRKTAAGELLSTVAELALIRGWCAARANPVLPAPADVIAASSGDPGAVCAGASLASGSGDNAAENTGGRCGREPRNAPRAGVEGAEGSHGRLFSPFFLHDDGGSAGRLAGLDWLSLLPARVGLRRPCNGSTVPTTRDPPHGRPETH